MLLQIKMKLLFFYSHHLVGESFLEINCYQQSHVKYCLSKRYLRFIMGTPAWDMQRYSNKNNILDKKSCFFHFIIWNIMQKGWRNPD